MTTAANNERRHIDQLHFEHKLWESSTRLYEDELMIFNRRLEEISEQNNVSEIRKQIEHFQNSFILQKEQLDILNHKIRQYKHALAEYAQKHPVAIDHVLFADHSLLRNEHITYDRIFCELKNEFLLFLNKAL